LARKPLGVGFDLIRRPRVAFRLGQFQQFRALAQPAV